MKLSSFVFREAPMEVDWYSRESECLNLLQSVQVKWLNGVSINCLVSLCAYRSESMSQDPQERSPPRMDFAAEYQQSFAIDHDGVFIVCNLIHQSQFDDNSQIPWQCQILTIFWASARGDKNFLPLFCWNGAAYTPPSCSVASDSRVEAFILCLL